MNKTKRGKKGKKDKEEERVVYVFVVGPGAGVIRCQSRLRRRTISDVERSHYFVASDYHRCQPEFNDD